MTAAGWKWCNWRSVPRCWRWAGRCWNGCWPPTAATRGPRIDCGGGHQAEFVAYRDKSIATVLGPVVLRRAWYHCTA